jgi:hypothetical protein
MILRKTILFLTFIVSVYNTVVAQDEKQGKDVHGVYRKIESFSSKNNFTSALYGIFLRPVEEDIPQVKVVGSRENEIYSSFEGKIIRSINIVTLDPFGYSIRDTTARPSDFLSKGGNALHVKTLNITIRNRLLIKKYDRFDSLLVKESERLIRTQSYIHDVAVRSVLTCENSDSVDVYIRVADVWSIVPDGAVSSNSFTIELADKNVGGFGHTFANRYSQNYIDGGSAFSTKYIIPNIKNTYISARAVYAVDQNRNYVAGFSAERPFYSPITRWAGGASLTQTMMPSWVYKDADTRLFLTSTYNIQDYWAAAALKVFKGNTVHERTTKLILSGRYLNINYLEKPYEQPDLMDYFANERFYMAGIGISSRKYVKQSYIFRFGTTEDVPVGMAFDLVGGYQLKNQERWYWGLKHSWGRFYNWGYWGNTFEYGTYINANYRTQGVVTASMIYFSGLFSIGSWNFRQFVRPELILGFRRTKYDRLTLNDGYGLNGFNSDGLSGTSRMLLVLQTQSYAPWNLMGFRFGPYINLSLGMLGDEDSGFGHSRMYPQIGFGVLIKNDYFVVKYFQVSFAYYPTIPGVGDNMFKANPLRTTDFGFQDFVIGKPETVDFR